MSHVLTPCSLAAVSPVPSMRPADLVWFMSYGEEKEGGMEGGRKGRKADSNVILSLS